MLRFSILSIFALGVGFVAAQTTYDIVDVSSCVIPCSLEASLAAGCTAYTELSCTCPSTKFQEAATACLRKTCPDLVTPGQEQIGRACARIGITPFTGLPTATGNGNGDVTTTPPTASGSGSESTRSASAFKDAPVIGAIGALAALVGAAIF